MVGILTSYKGFFSTSTCISYIFHEFLGWCVVCVILRMFCLDKIKEHAALFLSHKYFLKCVTFRDVGSYCCYENDAWPYGITTIWEITKSDFCEYAGEGGQHLRQRVQWFEILSAPLSDLRFMMYQPAVIKYYTFIYCVCVLISYYLKNRIRELAGVSVETYLLNDSWCHENCQYANGFRNFLYFAFIII